MGYNDQIPWFATSNGVIDLKTSADFRDHRYTNNEISNETVNGSKNLNEQEKELVDKPASSKSQKTIKSLKVIAGGLPPLANKQRRSSSLLDNNDNTFNGPPVPKDNELYGDILVIPPIKQKPFEEYPRFEFSKSKLNANRYATKKTIAQGMLDIALLASNASQLKYVLTVGEEHDYYLPMIILIISSIVLQVYKIVS